MRTLLIVLFALVSPRLASATPAGVAAVQDNTMSASVHGLLALPQGDSDNVTEASLGVRATFGYRVHRYVELVGAFEYVVGNERDLVASDITFYAIGVGARFAPPRSDKRLRPFGEILMGRHSVSIDDNTESDLGFRLGGGINYSLAAALALVAQVSYTTAEIEGADVDAFMFEGGLGWTF